MRKEKRQESSVSMQSRINVVRLAKLVKYWEESEYDIKTVSRLISWSIDLLCEILIANGAMSEEDMPVAEAIQVLEGRGMFQKSLQERGLRKLATAMSFEALREEGIDPKQYVQSQYKMLHNKRSVEPFMGKVVSEEGHSAISEEEWEMVQRKVKEEEKRKREEAVRRAIEERKDVFRDGKDNVSVSKEREDTVESGITLGKKMSEEQLMRKAEEIRKRDEERRELENAPPDVDFLKSKVVKVDK